MARLKKRPKCAVLVCMLNNNPYGQQISVFNQCPALHRWRGRCADWRYPVAREIRAPSPADVYKACSRVIAEWLAAFGDRLVVPTLQEVRAVHERRLLMGEAHVDLSVADPALT